MLLIIIIVLVVGIVIGAVVMGAREDRDLSTSLKGSAKENAAEKIGKGLNEHNELIQKEKDEKKKQIFGLFSGKEQITNDDVQKLLKISDATATRYLDELQADGKIENLGGSARTTQYRLKRD